MLKRLRLQFVAVIMVIVTIMLCTVFGMLYFFTRSSLEQESFAMMRAVPVGIMAPDRPLAPFARPGEQPEQVRLPFFVVQEAEDGTLTAAGVGYYDLSPGEAFDQTFFAGTDPGGGAGEPPIRGVEAVSSAFSASRRSVWTECDFCRYHQ